jgi:predicted nucleic acid-binding protein
MAIIDTSLVIERVVRERPIEENITIITAIEYPAIFGYKGFYGKVVYPEDKDLALAVEIQSKLMKKGLMKGAADLIIAAMAIKIGDGLITSDKNFFDISEVSDLKLI